MLHADAEHVEAPGSWHVRLWLLIVYGMIAAMVVVGGITRLTGSGLSMVEWHPLMGAIPPLNDAAWQETFATYQQSPQYRLVNHWMQLDDFKRIFMWEFLHRLLGRVIGLVFFIPMVWFWVRGALAGVHRRRAVIALLLGGSQGLLGWFMVKSGLVSRPEVSHFRLAAHLALALFVAQYVQLMWMSLGNKLDVLGRAHSLRRLYPWAVATLAVVALQIVSGAFMAGTRAGFLFSTFPDMNGTYWPPGSLYMEGGVVGNVLHNPVMIHAVHRALAIVVLGACCVLGVRIRRRASGSLRVAGGVLLALVLVQVLLGVITVVTHISIPVAVLHQLGGLAVLSSCTWILASLHSSRTTAESEA